MSQTLLTVCSVTNLHNCDCLRDTIDSVNVCAGHEESDKQSWIPVNEWISGIQRQAGVWQLL